MLIFNARTKNICMTSREKLQKFSQPWILQATKEEEEYHNFCSGVGN